MGFVDSFESDNDSAHVGSGPNHVTMVIELARHLDSWHTNGSKYEDLVFVRSDDMNWRCVIKD